MRFESYSLYVYITLSKQAFPDVPWAFVYRQPVQTMMSHMDPDKNNQGNAPCMRSKRNPPQDVSENPAVFFVFTSVNVISVFLFYTMTHLLKLPKGFSGQQVLSFCCSHLYIITMFILYVCRCGMRSASMRRPGPSLTRLGKSY